MNKRLLLLGASLGAFLAAGGTKTLTAQTIEANGIKVKVGGLMQIQFSTTSVDEAELIAAGSRPASPIPASMFEARRIRLVPELDYNGWLTAKMELEFAMARLQMREVYINLGFTPEFQLRAGQFKKPFSLLQIHSDSKWSIIERGVRQRGLAEAYTSADKQKVLTNFRGSRVVFGEEQDLLEAFTYQSYDIGAALLGNIGAFGYTVGVFNGPGTDANDDTNGKSIAGRATLRLLKSAPLVLGAGVSTREFRVTSTPNIVTRDGTALEADLELGDFRKKGLHVIAEVTGGRNLAVPDSLDNRNFLAAHAVAAWFVPVARHRIEGWELAGRVSWGDPRRDFDGDEGTLYSPGANIYFSGRNRLMVNLDVFVPAGSQFSTQHVIRTQAQIFF